MRALLCTSLAFSFLFNVAMTVLSGVLNDAGFRYIGFLLAPGEWLVYGLFDVNNHDILPFVMAESLNVFFYAIPIAAYLVMSARRKAR